jgi:replicative DNA helicase
MVILAARPGVGKTAFALNIAESVAIEQKQAVGVFSLEMSAEALVMRMLCARARVDSHKVRSGFLGKGDFTPLTNAASELIKAPIYIDDSANLGILHLRAKARRMKANQTVRLLIVDYLQLVTDESSRTTDGRQAEVAAVSRQLKALAKELQVPIVVLCQLNREIEKRGENARPRLADLRESGSIEQDADVVGFLVRKDDGEGAFSPSGEAEMVIAKQRNGPTGDVKLVFKGEYTRFFDAAKTTDEDAQEIRGANE